MSTHQARTGEILGYWVEEVSRGFPRLLHRFHHLVLRYALQDVERVEGVRNRARKPHYDERRMLPPGDVHELFYHHGGTIVEVRGTGEIEDDDLVIPDVRTDHRDQPVRRRDRETSP